MAHHFKISGQVHGQQFIVGSESLFINGLLMPVEVSTSALIAGSFGLPVKSIQILGLFDTGCTVTSVDHEVARLLGLTATGKRDTRTASGIATVDDYAVDLTFPGINLKGHSDFRVSSCDLQFKPGSVEDTLMNPKNFGIIIGRDLMSFWSVTWHGPTSTVFISD